MKKSGFEAHLSIEASLCQENIQPPTLQVHLHLLFDVAFVTDIFASTHRKFLPHCSGLNSEQ